VHDRRQRPYASSRQVGAVDHECRGTRGLLQIWQPESRLPRDKVTSIEISFSCIGRMDGRGPSPPPAAGLEQTRHGKIFA